MSRNSSSNHKQELVCPLSMDDSLTTTLISPTCKNPSHPGLAHTSANTTNLNKKSIGRDNTSSSGVGGQVKPLFTLPSMLVQCSVLTLHLGHSGQSSLAPSLLLVKPNQVIPPLATSEALTAWRS